MCKMCIKGRIGYYHEKRKTKNIYKLLPLQLKFIEFIKSPNIYI